MTTIDRLYEDVDTMMRSGNLDELGYLVRCAVVLAPYLETDMLVGMLTTTLPVKNKLPHRPRLLAESERLIRKRSHWRDGLLDGLGYDRAESEAWLRRFAEEDGTPYEQLLTDAFVSRRLFAEERDVDEEFFTHLAVVKHDQA